MTAIGSLAAVSIYQLRMELRDAETPVWRRLLVPSITTLHDLHLVLQRAMEWGDMWLYRFWVLDNAYGPKELSSQPHRQDFESFAHDFDDREVTVALALPRQRHRLTYSYNPREDVKLNVILQRVVPAGPGDRYPRCIAGTGMAWDDGSVENSGKIDPFDIDVDLTTEPSALASESPPASRSSISARRKFRKYEHRKNAMHIVKLTMDLVDTVERRPELAVRNAALVIEDTAWSALTALDMDVPADADPIAMLGKTLRISGPSSAVSVDQLTAKSILGVSPDVSFLHAGVSHEDASRAVEAAKAWCHQVIREVPALAVEAGWSIRLFQPPA